MTELETAIEKAKELEDRVKQLYRQAIASDAGIVTLKLLFPSTVLPEKHEHQYRGHLAVAIAGTIMQPYMMGCEWKVWLKSKKKSRQKLEFKVTKLEGCSVYYGGNLPWDFSNNHYFVYSWPGDLPF